MEHKLTGKYLEVIKGNRSLSISKNTRWYVIEVKELGSEYNYSVRLKIGYNGRIICLFARNKNILNNWDFNLNDGNPLKKIRVRVPYPG